MMARGFSHGWARPRLILQADADPAGAGPAACEQLVLQPFAQQLQLLHHGAGAQAFTQLLLGPEAW